MKVFDCFLFFNELDLLDLRLNLLSDHVDYFVIVESALTFQGEEKEFIFEKNINRFNQFKNKIIYFKIDKYSLNFNELPYIYNPQNVDEEILNRIYKFIDECPHFDKKEEFWWGNDFYQRECISRALATASPNKDDLILISDVDEIPNPNIIDELKKNITPQSLFCLQQHEFCYFLNYYHNSNWFGSCCFLYDKFKKTSLNAIRFSIKRDEGLSPKIINDAGWHFTSIGNINAIQNKIKSWGHREFNNKLILNTIEYNIKHGYDIFRRPGFGKLNYLEVNNNILPSIIKKDIKLYSHLVGPIIMTENSIQKIYHSFIFKINFKIYNYFKIYFNK